MGDTTSDNPPQEKPARIFNLLGHHYLAVELRYQGMQHDKIAETLAQKYGRPFSHQSVRRWFSKGHLLHDFYFRYAANESERRRREVQEQLKALVPHIPEKLRQIISERYETDKEGNFIRDENGEKVQRLDGLTLGAMHQLADILGLKVDSGPGGDPVDRFFDRVEDETPEAKPEDHAEPKGDIQAVSPPLA